MPLPSHDFTAQDILLYLIFIRSNLIGVNQYLNFVMPFIDKLFNSLPDHILLLSYDLNTFKEGVSRHLHDLKRG